MQTSRVKSSFCLAQDRGPPNVSNDKFKSKVEIFQFAPVGPQMSQTVLTEKRVHFMRKRRMFFLSFLDMTETDTFSQCGRDTSQPTRMHQRYRESVIPCPSFSAAIPERKQGGATARATESGATVQPTNSRNLILGGHDRSGTSVLPNKPYPSK